MSIEKDIPKLLNARVISPETAENIKEYYKIKDNSSSNRLFVVFGIIGAILVGLGIILIIAHNWDGLSRFVKTSFAFLPLLLGQVICGFVLIKKRNEIAWRESATVFLFLSVGSSISLVSQIYNIPGDISSFMSTWMLLCLPLIYIMKSSSASLLYLIGITYYAVETGYWTYPSSESFLFWILLLLALPHYLILFKRKPTGNLTIFHNWIFTLSVIISLGTVAKENEELMNIGYLSLFSLFYLIGDSKFFKYQNIKNNAYKLFGSVGSIGLLLFLSFDWFWEDIQSTDWQFNIWIISPEFVFSAILSILALILLYLHQKDKSLYEIKPQSYVFILFILVFSIGLYSLFAVWLINLMIFLFGIYTMWKGSKMKHLGILNYGLLIITALIICRFFDTNLSFIVRGILFVSVGVGFFASNYWLIKQKRSNE